VKQVNQPVAKTCQVLKKNRGDLMREKTLPTWILSINGYQVWGKKGTQKVLKK
jgi:hypothetical protein